MPNVVPEEVLSVLAEILKDAYIPKHVEKKPYVPRYARKEQ